jgi:hypothetical protein
VIELDDTAGDMFEAIRASRDFLIDGSGNPSPALGGDGA